MIEALIRRPKPHEYDSVRAIVQTVVDETYGGLWAPPPLPVDEEDWPLAWVAVVDMKIVGMVMTHEEWISDLWVLRESRGCGIGQRLLAQGEAEIAGRGRQIPCDPGQRGATEGVSTRSEAHLAADATASEPADPLDVGAFHGAPWRLASCD